MKKEEFPSANCVGVVTVRWSVVNRCVKTVYMQEFGFACAFPTKKQQKDIKESVQKQLQQMVEKGKAHFNIDENSVVRFSSSIKIMGCDFVLNNV